MLKHIFTLLLVLWLAAPALATENSSTGEATAATKTVDKTLQPQETVPASAGPTELNCKYYTVSVPDDWKTLMPPTQNQGMTSAIFEQAAGSAVVTMVIGPRGVDDAKTIAGLFAEQFKAEKPPVEKNGQFTFSFSRQGMLCQAWVATEGDVFMLTSIWGNSNEAQAFIRQHVKSSDYAKLLPK